MQNLTLFNKKFDNNKNSSSLEGTITKLYYTADFFSTGKIKEKNNTLEHSFSVKSSARLGDKVILNGKWVKDPKYGWQFKSKSMTIDFKLSKEELISYLSNHPDIKGIGEVKASNLVNSCNNFEEDILTDSTHLAKISKLPIDLIETVKKVWGLDIIANKLVAKLSSFNISHSQALKIITALGNKSLDIIQNNPYELIGLVHGLGFKTVDAIALKNNTVKLDSPSRIRAGLYHIVKEQLKEGHCYIKNKTLYEMTNTLLNSTVNSVKIGQLKEQLKYLVSEETDPKEQLIYREVGGVHTIMLPDIYEKEQYLVEVFGRSTEPNSIEISIDEQVINKDLNTKQKLALTTAIENTITLICGGAGVGKSYTIAQICQVYNQANLTIALAAPTGKAAQRLEELGAGKGSTIHMLLGYRHGFFTVEEIAADVVIIDEVSMLDIELAYELFNRIDLTRTSVILVGDHNQLPPVGAGNILRDLLISQTVPHVILDKVMRQAGILKENCISILQGEVKPTALKTIRDDVKPWYVADELIEPNQILKALGALFVNRLDQMKFDIIEEVQVLTPTNKNVLGVVELNKFLQRIVQKKLFNIDIDTLDQKFHTGDKIMQTKNDYELQVMNGTIGKIIDVMGKDIIVEFNGNRHSIKGEKKNNISLAYAMTVHKAQGSETPCVIVLANKLHTYMHHRNWLYTAVTRAKETCIILGNKRSIVNCAFKKQVDKRRTLLAYYLKNQARLKI